MYCTDESIRSTVLNKITNFNILKGKVIFTVFSRASNSEIGKNLDRRFISDIITKKEIQKGNRDENSLVKLLNNKEYNNNYTISYKNIYDDENTILALDPLLSKVSGLLEIKSEQDLEKVRSIFYNSEKKSSEKAIIQSMDKIMSSGFNRIVIVESDAIELTKTELPAFLAQIRDNKKKGKDLGENVFNLYKENIECIKYVNP